MDIEVKRQPERTELRVEILAPEGNCPPLQRLLAFLAAEIVSVTLSAIFLRRTMKAANALVAENEQ